jgi:hypothetical protein
LQLLQLRAQLLLLRRLRRGARRRRRLRSRRLRPQRRRRRLRFRRCHLVVVEVVDVEIAAVVVAQHIVVQVEFAVLQVLWSSFCVGARRERLVLFLRLCAHGGKERGMCEGAHTLT